MLYKANYPSDTSSRVYFLYGLVFMLASTLLYMTFSFGQKDFFGFFPFYTLAFLAYIGVCRHDLSTKQLIIFAVFTRVSLVFVFPSLSDDIYRFFWDGKLTINGLSPYGILPSELLNSNLPDLDQALFDKLNSPNYYTIYPPVNQVYFFLAAWFESITTATIVMKSLVIITEIIGFIYLIKLLKRLHINSSVASWYILNPLVIIEGVGNLHFEVVMVSFLTISIYYIFTNKLILGSFWLAISISIKLLPLMILPYFWFRLPQKEKWKFFTYLAVFLLIFFFPLFIGFQISSFLNSIDLYFRKFEFNASIYYILRFLGHYITGYNLIHVIGPLCGIITIGYNVMLANKKKELNGQNFLTYGLLVWTVYLLLATTVHPWYVISILFFSIFTKWQYAKSWSYLVIISYINYSGGRYYENPWWIALEYTILFGWMFWEISRNKNLPFLTRKIGNTKQLN